MRSGEVNDPVTGEDASGERYPDGWPVRTLDGLAAAIYEPTREAAQAINGEAPAFGSLDEWERDDYRLMAASALEFLNSERDALRKTASSVIEAYDALNAKIKGKYSDDFSLTARMREYEAALAALRKAVK